MYDLVWSLKSPTNVLASDGHQGEYLGKKEFSSERLTILKRGIRASILNSANPSREGSMTDDKQCKCGRYTEASGSGKLG